MALASRIMESYASCVDDMYYFKQVLTPLSAASTLAVLVIKARTEKAWRFPDNLTLISWYVGYSHYNATCSISHCQHSSAILGAFSALLIGMVFKDRHTDKDASGFYSALCYIQALTFESFRTAFIWNWFLSMIVTYLVVVRQTAMNELRKKSRWYYWTLALLTSIQMIASKLEKVPQFNLCWISDSGRW